MSRHEAKNPCGGKRLQIRILRGKEADEAPLADLEYSAAELTSREIEALSGHALAVELDAALGDQTPRLAARHAEHSRDQRRQVHVPPIDAVGLGERELRDVVGDLMRDVDRVEVRLGGLARAL